MSSTLDINKTDPWNDSSRTCDAVARWGGVGYNFIGFHDQGFTAERYTREAVPARLHEV